MTRKKVEERLRNKGWNQRVMRRGGPTVFGTPAGALCFVTHEFVCLVDLDNLESADWASLGEAEDFLVQHRL